MVNTDALFRIGDAAEDEGNFDLARLSFERGAALGDTTCLCRLARMFDVGVGIAADKPKAMRLYQRAWRRDKNSVAGSNIAILYRERSDFPAAFRWWRRVADEGDGSACLEIAKCYLSGIGVKRCPQSALRSLAAAVGSDYITEYERDEAQMLIDRLRPRQV